MIEAIYRISFPMVPNKLINKLFFVWNKIVAAFLRAVYPAYCRRHPVTSGVTDYQYDHEIVVSLKTFPPRYESAVWALESMLRQSMKPNKILLWLTKEENPGQAVPERFVPYVEKGVQICFSDLNLKPHDKCFHTALLDANRYIITVDDDVLYSEKLIERLYTTYRENPANTVVCQQAHQILLDEAGIPKPYSQWGCEAKGMTGPSHLLMAKGAGGVLYPPGFFRDVYFDVDTIQRTCPFADDLWLKFNEILRGYPVVKTRKYAKNVITSTMESQKVSLNSINNGEKRNDVQLKNLIAEFPDIPWTHLQ